MTRKNMKWLGWAALAAVVAIGTGVAYWRSQVSPTGGFATAKVMQEDIGETISALGVLVPSQYVDVGAQVSGQIVKLPVALGDMVKQ